MKQEHKTSLEAVAAASGVNVAVWTVQEVSLYLQVILAAVSIIWVIFQIFRAWEDRGDRRRKEREEKEKGH